MKKIYRNHRTLRITHCALLIALLMILAAIQFPCAGYAAEEDRELAMIAAEQEKSKDKEQLDKINPALTDSITTKQSQETDKEIKERKKKLKQMRKEKEKENERILRENANQKVQPRTEEAIVIQPTEPTPKPQPITPPKTSSTPQPIQTPKPIPTSQPTSTAQPTSNGNLPTQKRIYASFIEVTRTVHFIPLYMPRKSGYEITGISAGENIVEVRYGRRWETTVSLAVRTHKRAAGEELQDISGVTGVKWRVDNTTGTTIYIAKISDTQHVAAWAVGQYTFSAQSENLSFAGFYSLVADELVELSRYYYIDL